MYRPLLLLALVSAVALPAAAQPALFTPADDARASLTARQAGLLGHLEAIPAAAEVHLVEVHTEHIEAPSVRFNLMAGGEAVLTLERAAYRLAGPTGSGASYFFRSDDDGTFAILVAREGQLTGSVRISGQLYAVRPLTGGLHAVARMAEDRFVDHAPEWEAVEAEAAARWAERPFVPEAVHDPHDAPEAGTIIHRVLVPYTPNAESQVADILSLVQLAIDETNEGYSRSDIAHQIALAHTYRTPQNESSNFSTTLTRMQNPSDGFHDEIAGLRDEYGADLVNMIVGQNGGLCGQASTILADGPDEAHAVSSQSCATGYYTFGHELGHLQGARHNPEADGSSSPFPYGHGKYYQPGSWRTVMSYACPGGCTRVLQWSNPDVLYNGVPSGDAALRDNARVLNETAATIAAFYPEPNLGVASVEVTRLGPASLGAGGGPMPFSATVSASGDAFAGQGWVTATMPDGSDYGLLFGPLAVSLSDGQSVSRTMTARVPALAPTGTYTITVSVGASYPDEVEDSASFTFEKAASLVAAPVDDAARWSVTLDEGPADGVPAEASAGVAGSTGGLALLGTAPNPMRGAATVRYALDAAGAVRVSVFDVLGREVAVLADGPVEAGRHAAAFDARGLPAGVYVVRVQSTTPAGTAVATQHVTLAR